MIKHRSHGRVGLNQAFQALDRIALLGDRVHFTIFVDRTGSRRIISLRKANQRAFDRYVSYLYSTNG